MSNNNRKYISLIPNKEERKNEYNNNAHPFKTIAQCYKQNVFVIKPNNYNYKFFNNSNDAVMRNLSRSCFYEKLFQSTSNIKKHLHKVHMNLFNEEESNKNKTNVPNKRKTNQNVFRFNAKTTKNFKDVFGINELCNSKGLEMVVNQIQNNSNKRILQYNKVIKSISQQLPYQKKIKKIKDDLLNNNINIEDEVILDKTSFTSNPLSKKNSIKTSKEQNNQIKQKQFRKANSFEHSSTSNSKENNQMKVKSKKKINTNGICSNLIANFDNESNAPVETSALFDFVNEKNGNEEEFPFERNKFEKVNSFTDLKKGLFDNEKSCEIVKDGKGKKVECVSNEVNINSVSVEGNEISNKMKRGKSTDAKGLVFDGNEGNDIDGNNTRNWGCNVFSSAFHCGCG